MTGKRDIEGRSWNGHLEAREHAVSVEDSKAGQAINRQPSSPERQPIVRLQIEQLALEGLPIDRSQSSLLKTAVEAELARLLAGCGSHPQPSHSEVLLAGGEIQLPPEATLQQWSKEISRMILGACNLSQARCTASKGGDPDDYFASIAYADTSAKRIGTNGKRICIGNNVVKRLTSRIPEA